jgi:hypothetical protein
LFFDGTSVVELGDDELEEDDEEDELDEELDDIAGITHGGTISVDTLELAGTTSWLVGWAPALCWAWAPPGVTSTVLAAGGETAPLELDDELEEEDDEDEEEVGGGAQG